MLLVLPQIAHEFRPTAATPDMQRPALNRIADAYRDKQQHVRPACRLDFGAGE
jgi:hypothetical protein